MIPRLSPAACLRNKFVAGCPSYGLHCGEKDARLLLGHASLAAVGSLASIMGQRVLLVSSGNGLGYGCIPGGLVPFWA